jgi:hypothetical protein
MEEFFKYVEFTSTNFSAVNPVKYLTENKCIKDVCIMFQLCLAVSVV